MLLLSEILLVSKGSNPLSDTYVRSIQLLWELNEWTNEIMYLIYKLLPCCMTESDSGLGP